MARDQQGITGTKARTTGFAVSCALNVLVVLSVLVSIPFAGHTHDFNPFFLVAFFNQMETVGVIAACVAGGEFYLNFRNGMARGKTLSIAGLVLAFTPLPIGLLLLRIVAKVVGWHLE